MEDLYICPKCWRHQKRKKISDSMSYLVITLRLIATATNPIKGALVMFRLHKRMIVEEIAHANRQDRCRKQAIALKTLLTPYPVPMACIAPTVCAVVPILRHGRPSSWANRESSRITVAECFACLIWIIANWQSSIALARQPDAACTSTPSTSSSLGTAPNPGWHSTASLPCAIACTLNQEVWPQILSTSNSQLFEGSPTKLRILACSALNWLRGSAE